LPAIAFSASWGGGTQHLSQYDLSKVFPLLVSILIARWFLRSGPKVIMPIWLTRFLFFTLIHTLIVFVVFFPNELTYGYTGVVELGGDFFRAEEGKLLVIFRFYLFALFSYALAIELKSMRQIAMFSGFYGLGLASVSFAGGYQSITQDYIRLAGGFLNPNSFGLAGLTAMFLGFIAFYSDNKLWNRILSFISIGTGGYVLVVSSSRGNILGALSGIFVVVLLSRLGNKVKMLVAALVLLVSLVFVVPNEYLVTVSHRFEYDQIVSRGGSGRLPLWQDYLRHFGEYSAQGVGATRSMTVIENDWTDKLLVTHNTYLQIIVEYGIVGFFLFMATLSSFWKRAVYIKQKNNSLPIALFVALSVTIFFGCQLTSRDTWIILGVLGATTSNTLLKPSKNNEKVVNNKKIQ